jgi:hypothetical protein
MRLRRQAYGSENLTGKNAIIVSVSLLLLAAFFGCTGSIGSSSVWAKGWGWEGLVGVAFAITFSLLAIGYMAGSLLMDDKLKAWAKKEVGQAFYSVLIILAVLAIVGLLDSSLKPVIADAGTTQAWQNYVNYAVCCTPGAGSCLALSDRPCHVAVAYDYLQLLYESLRSNAVAFFINHYNHAFLSFLNIGFSSRVLVHLGSLNIRPLSGLSFGVEFFSLLFDLAIKNMMLIRLQQSFLDYLLAAFFPVMISIGIVLRIFYFSRKLGGLLIALALSAYYVFPMFYVVCDAVFFQLVDAPIGASYKPGPVGVASNPLDPDNQVLVGNAPDGYALDDVYRMDPINVADFCAPTQGEVQENEGKLAPLKDRWADVQGGSWYKALGDFFNVATGSAFKPEGPVGSLGFIMVFSLVLPFLALMTTLATFKALSPLLGGDVEISLLSRLI